MSEYLFKYTKRTGLKKDEEIDPTKIYGSDDVVEIVTGETAQEALDEVREANEDEIRLKDITKL